MYQATCDESFGLLKGMSEKENYFGNENSVIDLETNIPTVFHEAKNRNVKY